MYREAVGYGAGDSAPEVTFTLEEGMLNPDSLLIWFIMSFTLLMMSALY